MSVNEMGGDRLLIADTYLYLFFPDYEVGGPLQNPHGNRL